MSQSSAEIPLRGNSEIWLGSARRAVVVRLVSAGVNAAWLRSALVGLLLTVPACRLAPRNRSSSSNAGMAQSASKLFGRSLPHQAPAAPKALPARRAPKPMDNFSGCYVGYPLGEQPERDVARLGWLCGPSNGMRRVERANKRAEEGVSMLMLREVTRAGQCWRWFFVAGRGVTGLEFEIEEAGGQQAFFEGGGPRWAVIPATRPYCAASSGLLQLKLRTRQGEGQVAFEAWTMSSAPLSSHPQVATSERPADAIP